MRVLRSKGSHDNAASAPRPIADGSQEREARRDSPKSDPRALVQSTKLTLSITAPGNVPNPRSGCQPNHLRLTIFDCRLALSKLANWQCPALSAAPRANNHNGFVILGLRPQVRVGENEPSPRERATTRLRNGSGSDRMREFYSKGKRDRFLFRLNGSIPYRSGFCTAIARFAGSFVIGNFDTGAYVSPRLYAFACFAG